MIISLNGNDADWPEGTSLDDLVVSLGKGRNGLAAAVNGDVVPRGAWVTTIVSPSDSVEVLGAAPGG